MIMDDDDDDDFIGWKLEDISEILHSLSGLEIPEDPLGDWSEPTNGQQLTDYQKKSHSKRSGGLVGGNRHPGFYGVVGSPLSIKDLH